MLDDYPEFWISLGNLLGKSSEFSLCTMDESFRYMAECVFRESSFRMKRENYPAFYHCSKYFPHILIIRIDITSRVTTIRRDSAWVILHGSDFSSTCMDDLRCCLRFQGYGHDRCSPFGEKSLHLFSICIYFFDCTDMLREKIRHRENLRKISLQWTYSFEYSIWFLCVFIGRIAIIPSKMGMEVAR